MATAAVGHVFAWLQLRSTRTFDLRQSVYLEAAAATAGGLDFFTKAMQINTDDSDLAQILSGSSVALYKIHVVGTPETIEALSKANERLTLSAVELMRKRAALRSATEEADLLRRQRELARAAIEGSLLYQRELREVNISARRELGVPLDESRYRAVTIAAEQRLKEAIGLAIDTRPE